MARLIAYGIAGHHGGMPDGTGETASLADRLVKGVETPDPIWQDQLPVDATGLWPRLNPPPDRTRTKEMNRAGFQAGFLGRMLFSCLVDGDYRDTEAYYARARGKQPIREQAALPGRIDALVAKFDQAMEATQHGARPTLVNQLRGDILKHVRVQASQPPGIFTLTVPTGGGKTLASLGFALDHAKSHNLDRIIYAIPFTSVIDQTADIFRGVLGDQNVLEHHSAMDDEKFWQRAGADKLRLAMEDWAVPVVVTTNVQLFQSLFSNRPSKCRKLHNLARSVIILDEAQTIPLPVLLPCVAALDELARNYGTTIVLCTATQPALTAPAFQGGFSNVTELAPEPIRLYDQLRRVTIRHAGRITDADLVAALSQQKLGLVIVNSRRHALDLYRLASASLEGVVHLTTRQYAAHRRLILADIRERLKTGRSCRVIATSLIEAGVDVDFPAVWRAEAGIDQIAQAAGRCNREGKRDPAESIVTVFVPDAGQPPRSMRQQIAAGTRVMGRYTADLLAPAAIGDYFREVYWQRQTRGLDASGVMGVFRTDTTGIDMAYQTVADNFALIDDVMEPIIIARDAPAVQALARLTGPEAKAGSIARTLQSYIVQIQTRDRAQLMASGAVAAVEPARFGTQFTVLRDSTRYDPIVGLIW